MLSSVLNSERAIEVNIAIMRAFVRLREIMTSHKDLARKLDDLERKFSEHDQKFHIVFEAIRQLMAPPPEPAEKRRIGMSPCGKPSVSLLVLLKNARVDTGTSSRRSA
jgi:hypothetical protein